MQNKKIHVVILFGGRSAEHEVSIQSAKNVYQSLDRSKYEVLLIGIDKQGTWHRCPENFLSDASFANQKQLANEAKTSLISKDQQTYLTADEQEKPIDVVFPVLHGSYGEDGTMQGYLKLVNVPFVGPSVLGSAVAMDKDVTKRLLRDAGLPIGKFLVFHKQDTISPPAVIKYLGLPVFVKPANQGSSVGVSKVVNEGSLLQACEEAFRFDTKILIEESLPGREIECSVLGNESPIVSIPGEIVATKDFYSYEAKYLDEEGATLTIPAKLTEEQVREVQDLALKAYEVLCLEGMARVDCFLTGEGKFYVNEANTIPGFTNISMYPKLWEASGISYPELVDRLITLAIERHEREKKLATSL